MKYAAALFIACAMLGCSGQPEVPVGPCLELFWDVPFLDLEGRPARLPCEGHQVLVVNFWATWCGPCKLEIPQLAQIAQEYGPRGVRLVGICLDAATPENLQPAVKALGINYPVLVGGAEKVLGRTGIDAIPATLIIAADGTVYRRLDGYHTREELLAPITELLNKIKEHAQP